MTVEWLSRQVARQGPSLALVLCQADFDYVLSDLGVPGPIPYLREGHFSGTTHYLRDGAGETACVVAVGDTSKASAVQVYGLLVHEAVHVWQHYREMIGETNPGHEQEAYAIQNIAQELMTEYSRRTSGL